MQRETMTSTFEDKARQLIKIDQTKRNIGAKERRVDTRLKMRSMRQASKQKRIDANNRQAEQRYIAAADYSPDVSRGFFTSVSNFVTKVAG